MTTAAAERIERIEETIQNGTITIRHDGDHRTFRIKTVRKGALEGRRLIELMTGTDNEGDYEGFGFVTDTGITVWRKFQTDRAFPAFARLVWSMMTEGEKSEFVKSGYQLDFSGSCIRCNRKLTNPASIDAGIGPECAGM